MSIILNDGINVMVPEPGPAPEPAPPGIVSVTPDEGPLAGGTEVTLTGDNLDTVTEVTFGGDPGTGLTVDGADLVVTSPEGSGAGPVDVEVTNPDGSDIVEDGFTYTDE